MGTSFTILLQHTVDWLWRDWDDWVLAESDFLADSLVESVVDIEEGDVVDVLVVGVASGAVQGTVGLSENDVKVEGEGVVVLGLIALAEEGVDEDGLVSFDLVVFDEFNFDLKWSCFSEIDE